jgi:hypothetical protein
VRHNSPILIMKSRQPKRHWITRRTRAESARGCVIRRVHINKCLIIGEELTVNPSWLAMRTAQEEQ